MEKNHTQNLLLKTAAELREDERKALTWGGPDPRGAEARKQQLATADLLEQIANTPPF